MITMESHLTRLVHNNQVDLLEAKKWVNNIKAFTDCLQREH
jgi:hypothetical protein